MKKKTRSSIIVRTSIIGISLNILLVIIKTIIGFAVNSIAIITDAVNNLTDALSSIITIIGTKLASKEPDAAHPLGHGRIEYLSSMVIAIFVILAGFGAFLESFKKILSGDVPNYNITAVIVLVIAILVKVFIFLYYKKAGKETNSSNLINSGIDAGFDAVISTSTLVAVLVFMFTKGKICIEAYLALIISLLILKSGIGMIRDAISIILGKRIDKDLSFKVKNVALSFKEVEGVYDLVLNNYGPNSYIGSFHIEVDESMNAVDIDVLTRRVTKEVYEKTGVVVSAIGIYSLNKKDKKAIEMKKQIDEILAKYPDVLSTHGFYVNQDDKTINIDIIISFESKNRYEMFKKIEKEIDEVFKDYKLYAVLDSDMSD